MMHHDFHRRFTARNTIKKTEATLRMQSHENREDWWLKTLRAAANEPAGSVKPEARLWALLLKDLPSNTTPEEVAKQIASLYDTCSANIQRVIDASLKVRAFRFPPSHSH